MLLLLFCLHSLCFLVITTSIGPEVDSIPYTVRWTGPIETATKPETEADLVSLKMITKNQESYECRFQNSEKESSKRDWLKTYEGPSPSDILMSFTKKVSCSYRVESFWSYELCHLKHLRQYHEEKSPTSDTGSVITQEYSLGKYSNTHQLPDEVEEGDVPTITLEGTKYPYHLTEYSDGTTCDLTGSARRTLVYYICHESGRGEIHQIKETSTCEYSAVILLAELCNHPLYRPNKETSRVISCYSLHNSPEKPLEQERMDQLLSTRLSDASKLPVGLPVSAPTGHSKSELDALRTDIGEAEDENFLKQFLTGEECLTGGSGWWSHEFCYGKYVQQYHTEKGKRVTTILLGEWNLGEHKNWLKNNPNKTPKNKQHRRYISQYYTGGDYCEDVKKYRAVEVKLKCITTKSSRSSSHSVAISIVEPSTCEYILTIESQLLCKLIEQADDNALITL